MGIKTRKVMSFVLMLFLCITFISQNMTVEAAPKKNGATTSYSITYVLNGGINNSENPDKIVNNVQLKNPTKEGYEFLGWYLDAKFTKPAGTIKSNTKSNVTVYAKWAEMVAPEVEEETEAVVDTEEVENAEVKEPEKEPEVVTEPETGNTTQVLAENAIFVSLDGNDNNDGSLEAPYKNIQTALDKVKAGQTIYVREGVYDGLLTFKSSGNAVDGLITLTSYPGEHVKLTYSGVDYSAYLIKIEGCEYIKISDLEMADLSATKTAIAVRIIASWSVGPNHIYIENNDIHNIATLAPDGHGTGSGIHIYGNGTRTDNSIHDIYVINNQVHNNANGYAENITISGNCEYIHILNNRVYDNLNIGIDIAGNYGTCSNIALDQARNIEIIGNVTYNNRSPYAASAGIYVDGAKDVLIQGNTSYGNMYGIEIGSEVWDDSFTNDKCVQDIIITGNEVYGNDKGGIHIGGYTTDNTTGVVRNCTISGNTLTNNASAAGEMYFSKVDNILVKDNIINKSDSSYPTYKYLSKGAYSTNVVFENNTVSEAIVSIDDGKVPLSANSHHNLPAFIGVVVLLIGLSYVLGRRSRQR